MNARRIGFMSGILVPVLLVVFSLVLSGCGGGSSLPTVIPPAQVGDDPTRPSIFRLVPNSGLSGDEVVIEGANFGKEKGSSVVSYNGEVIEIASGEKGMLWSNTAITVVIPGDARTGLMIVNKAGKQSFSSKNAIFYVTTDITEEQGDPQITGISPTSLPPESVLLIKGESFGDNRGSSFVRLGTFLLEVNTNTVFDEGLGELVVEEQWSATHIEVVIPEGAESGPVIVVVGGVESNSNFEITIEERLVVDKPVAITSFVPSRAAVGQTVTINGENFGNHILTSYVLFNGKRADVVSWSDTQLLVNVPQEATSGSLQVVVRNIVWPVPGQEVPVAQGALIDPVEFEVILIPQITGLSPVSAVLGGLVSLHGIHFGNVPGTVNVSMASNAAITTEMFLEIKITPGGVTGGPFEVGEKVESRSSESGPFLGQADIASLDGGSLWLVNVSGAFDSGNSIVGKRSGATATQSGSAEDVSSPFFQWTDSRVTFIMPNDINVTLFDDRTFKPGTVKLTTWDNRVTGDREISLKNAFDGQIVVDFLAAPVNQLIGMKTFPLGGSGNFSYKWDFGNGTSGSSQSVEVSYSSTGKFTPSVRVTDSASEMVSLFIGPEIRIGPEGIPILANLQVTGISSGEPSFVPVISMGNIPRALDPNLGKRLARFGDEVTIVGFNFGDSQGNGLVRITRDSAPEALPYSPQVVLWKDQIIKIVIEEESFSMAGKVWLIDSNLVQSDNDIFLAVVPRIISNQPAEPTVSGTNSIVVFQSFDARPQKKIEGPLDIAERTTLLIIDMADEGWFIVEPADFKDSSVTFNIGGWRPLGDTGQPFDPVPGSWTFYLWGNVLKDGMIKDIVNSGVISDGHVVTIS